MKNILLSLVCLFSFNVQAFEYETQFENEQIRVGRAKIAPHEEFGHRLVHPQILIAMKEGTITSLDAEGKATETQFPTGVAVYRDADSEEFKSVNNSSEPVELVIIQLKNSPPIVKDKVENSHDIFLSIKLNCPMSPEFQEFVKSIPPEGYHSSNFYEWKSSFINNMNHLTRLVESEKVHNSWWGVDTHKVSEVKRENL